MNSTVFVVNGTTESGDDWTLVFATKPTDEQIEALIQANDWLREEWVAECIQGWHVVEETVIQ